MTDADGKLKFGLYLRRCVESKKAKKPALTAVPGTPASAAAAIDSTASTATADVGSNNQSGAEADSISISEAYDVAFEVCLN